MDSNKEMSEFVSEAREVLNKIEAHHEIHEQQLKAYKEMMDISLLVNKERIDQFEKRWANIRSVIIVIVGIFLLSFVSDKIELRNRPTNEDIGIIIDEIKEDYVTKDNILRGFGVIIEDRYDIMERLGTITHDESKTLKSEVKKDVQTEVDPKTVSRSPIITK